MAKLKGKVLALIIFGSIMLSGCNMQVVDLEYSYNYAIIEGVGEVKVAKWCDYENSDMLQVIDTDGVVYLSHSSNIILMKK